VKRILGSPATMLFLLAPGMGELLSGSTPPLVLVIPIVAVWEALLYGCGALLVREFTRRWGGGWPTVLILGAAYALMEEGVSLKVIFDTTFEPAGRLATYGRIGELNSVFTIQILVFHAVVSIALPILITELAHPQRRDTLWLGRRGMVITAVLWAASLAWGFAVVRPFEPPAGAYFATVITIIVLIVLANAAARRWPASTRPDSSSLVGLRWLGLFAMGAVASVLFLGFTWGGPDERPAPFTAALQIATTAITAAALTWLGRRRPLSDPEKLALACGLVAVFVVADLFKLAGGIFISGVIALVGFFVLGRRLVREQRVASNPG
jgi:hypothetical protein